MQSDTLQSLSQITEFYSPSLARCNDLIQETLTSVAPQTADMAEALNKSRGKQLRQLLVLPF